MLCGWDAWANRCAIPKSEATENAATHFSASRRSAKCRLTFAANSTSSRSRATRISTPGSSRLVRDATSSTFALSNLRNSSAASPSHTLFALTSLFVVSPALARTEGGVSIGSSLGSQPQLLLRGCVWDSRRTQPSPACHQSRSTNRVVRCSGSSRRCRPVHLGSPIADPSGISDPVHMTSNRPRLAAWFAVPQVVASAGPVFQLWRFSRDFGLCREPDLNRRHMVLQTIGLSAGPDLRPRSAAGQGTPARRGPALTRRERSS